MTLPQRIGPYRILERLGEGGMGVVWLAEQREPIRRRVAVKVVRAGLDSADVLARFHAERQALALMEHPHIARALDAGVTEDGRPYFVMELVRGEPITEHCDRVRASLRERCELMVKVCDAIHHAHQRAVIHRDIKPTNVLIAASLDGDGRGQPKVIDFGVSKAVAGPLTDLTLRTEFGQVLGTPGYMSPEQAESGAGDRVDIRTDVYSLGVLLYELLVGSMPVDLDDAVSKGPLEVLQRLRDAEPTRPSTRLRARGDSSTDAAARRRTTPKRLQSRLRGDLDWIVMRAIERDPARRYGSAADLARELERYLRGEPVLAGPPSGWYRARRFAGRHRVAVGFTSVVALLVATLAVTMTLQSQALAVERDRAEHSAELARREATTSGRVAEFLVRVFDQAAPEVTAGREPTARELLEQGANSIELLQDEPAVQARIRVTLAGVLMELGDFDRASALLQPALAVLDVADSPDRYSLGQALQLQATLLDAWQSESQQAEAVARRAVAIWQELGEPEHLARTLNTLAGTLWHQGDLEAATEVFHQSIAEFGQALGKNSPSTAMPLTNLGSMHLLQGDLDAAEQAYRKVLAIEEAQHPDDRSVSLGTTLHLLAMVHEQREEFAEAIRLETRSLAAREAVLGAEHWHVALSLTTLGNLYRANGRVEDSRPLLERAVRIAAATWEGHPDLWWAQRSLASTLLELGDHQAAVALLEPQRELLEELGEADWLVEVLGLLGEAAEASGELDLAHQRYAEALDALRPLVDADAAEVQHLEQVLHDLDERR